MPADSATLNGFDCADLDAALDHAGPALDALAGRSVFVTGGTGFIGQWVLALLARANAVRGLGVSVTALTRSRDSFAARCPDLADDPAIRTVEGDVRHFDYPKGRFDYVIHGATDTSAAADREPLKLADTILGGTRRVLDFAMTCGAKRVLIMSSGAVYGAQPEGLDGFPEDYAGACATTDRRSAYGQAKRMAEQLATIYRAEYGLDAVVCRLFAFVGPGMALDGHFAIGNFIRDAVAGETVTVGGDGTPLRSYLYAGDLAAWLVRILTHEGGPEAVNVGSGEAVSIADLAALVAATVPGAQGVEIKGTPQPGGFRSRYTPDVTLARETFGAEAWTPLAEAIARTVEWARRRPDESHAPAPGRHANEGSKGEKSLTFVVDIDGVIASLTPDNDYAKATPQSATITAINRLYDAGHRIVLFTARGSATGIDWSEVTRGQMDSWGVRYHDLRFGKPAADFYIDDRMLSVAEFGNILDAMQ